MRNRGPRTGGHRVAVYIGGKSLPTSGSQRVHSCNMTSDLLSGSNIHRSSKILRSHASVAQGHPGASRGGQSG